MLDALAGAFPNALPLRVLLMCAVLLYLHETSVSQEDDTNVIDCWMKLGDA